MDSTETEPKPFRVIRGQWPIETQLLLRKEYITGQGSLPALCEKHRIPFKTAVEWHKDGEWTKKRKQWVEQKKRNFDRQLTYPGTDSPESVSQPEQMQDITPQTPVARAQRIDRLITKAEAALENALDAREMQAAAMALDRLYSTWSLLTGHERPGVRKAQRPRRGPVDLDGMPSAA